LIPWSNAPSQTEIDLNSETVQRPRVGLTLRITDAETYAEPRDSISHDWIRCLDAWAMDPVLIPNAVSDPARYLANAKLDLLILTGGDSIGATPLRDRTETILSKTATEIRLPVLGVCRGMQLMCEIAGGQTQEIEGHVANAHEVRIGEPLQQLYGKVCTVNSYHNIGVHRDRLGDGYLLAAEDREGFAEAMVHTDFPNAAIMWHPERDGGQGADRVLIGSMIERGAFWFVDGV
jgi:gamma-glutamyl-gamma-aminobutyrate hydrolase PuuD